MEEQLSRSRKILFTVLIVVCVTAILKLLYDMGYFSYTQTDAFNYGFHIDETLWYRIYYNDILSVLLKVFFYTGLVGVYTLWEKPRPTLKFSLFIIALVLPRIISEVLNIVIDNQISNNNYTFVMSLGYHLYIPIMSVVWTAFTWITLAMLYSAAEKKAKPILISYMVIFAIGMAGSIDSYSSNLAFINVFNITYLYVRRIAEVLLYVFTLIYLKQKLGTNMPFNNAYRFAKKECTNHPPEDE